MRAGRFPCDCCGHWTLTAAPDGESLQLCAVCGWEDSEYWQGGELALDLFVAQRAFVDDGVAVPLLREQVRAPTADEVRDPRWQPYDGRRRELLARVEPTFEHARLPRGLSPTEAILDSRAVDLYGAPGESPPPGLWHPLDAHHWQELTRAGVLALFCGVGGLNFMHGATFRFFLPAVARLYLVEQAVATRYDGPWFPLFHFSSIDERRRPDFDGYPRPQRAWLAEFFAFATRPGSFASRRGRPPIGERLTWQQRWLEQAPDDYLAIYGSA